MIGAAPAAIGGLEHDAGEIADKDEIAPRLGDEATLSLRQPVEKDRQWPADVARADDIGETKGHPVDAAELDIVLPGGLRDRVAVVRRIDRMVEGDRLLAAAWCRSTAPSGNRSAARPCSLAGVRDVGAADAIGQRVRRPSRRDPCTRRRYGSRHRGENRRSARSRRAGRRCCPRPARAAGAASRLSRRPVAKLSIATTSLAAASSRSMTVEPTRPDPPVTNTFMPVCS